MSAAVFRKLLIVLALLPATGCSAVHAQSTDTAAPDDHGNSSWAWNLPAWLPPPPEPAGNPMTSSRVELGRYLFHDGRLSADGSVACATCHQQSRAFSDGRRLAVGIDNSQTARNTPGLANVAYSPKLTWSNPHMKSLEFQVLIPLFSESSVEMGNAGRERELYATLAADPVYEELFKQAFPERNGEIDIFTLTRALAAFQRTLISVRSNYDRYNYGGQTDAISASAKRGLDLFFSERLECYHCHQGFNFTDTLRTSRSRFEEVAYHNTGLYNVADSGRYPAASRGLSEFTGRPQDNGRFRTPSLRNVTLTAPYFHDGSAATLDDVIDHYAAGGRSVTDGPDAGTGAQNPNKNALILGFTLSEVERLDLMNFLQTLTDHEFINNPAFADPWPIAHPARAQRRDNTHRTKAELAEMLGYPALLLFISGCLIAVYPVVLLLRYRRLTVCQSPYFNHCNGAEHHE